MTIFGFLDKGYNKAWFLIPLFPEYLRKLDVNQAGLSPTNNPIVLSHNVYNAQCE